MSDKWQVFILLGLAVTVSSIGEALASKGMKKAEQAGDLLTILQTASQDWHVVVGVILLLLYVALYVYALGKTELSFAVPLLAFSYVFGLISSRFYLHEDIKPARVIGTMIIIIGVLTIAFAGSSGGSDKKSSQKSSGASSSDQSQDEGKAAEETK